MINEKLCELYAQYYGIDELVPQTSPLGDSGGRNGWKLNHSPVGLAHFQTVATKWH